MYHHYVRSLVALAFIGLLIYALSSQSQAAVVAGYDFGAPESPTLAATIVASGITATDVAHNTQTDPLKFHAFNRATALANVGSATATNSYLQMYGVYSFANTTAGSTITDLDPGTNVDYWSIKLTSAEPFDIDELAFDYAAVSVNRGWLLAYSTNGFSTYTTLGSKWTISGGEFNFEHYTFAIGESAVTQFEVRWFIGTNNAGQLNGSREELFDNLSVTGSVGAVPEPASLTLLVACSTLVLRPRLRPRGVITASCASDY